MDLKLLAGSKILETDKKESFLGRLFKKNDNKPLREYGVGLKLAFIVGHEKAAGGAWGASPLNMNEYEWSKSLGILVLAIARAKGIECEAFFRDKIGIRGAYKAAHDWGAWSIIESHFNSYNSEASGSETLCSKDEGSQKFAACVQSQMCLALGRTGTSRGVKVLNIHDRGGLNVNLYPKSVLIEPFFGDNVEEAKLAVEKKERLAGALVAAFFDFIA